MNKTSWINSWVRFSTPLGELVDSGLLVGRQGTGRRSFRRYPSFALVLVVEGTARYRDESGLDVALQCGDCIWVTPDCAHQYGPERGSNWTELYISFSGESFAEWSKESPFSLNPILHLQNVAAWFPRWESIALLKPKNRHEAVSALIKIHLLLSDLAATAAGEISFVARMETIKLRLEAWPPGTDPDWRLLALECKCGYEKWRKAFRELFGVPPARFRREALMHRAAILMISTCLTNSELADRFGCVDAFHFSKLFKHVHGLSPRAYRNQVVRAPTVAPISLRGISDGLENECTNGVKNQARLP